jgi:hypothetical protein
LSLKGDWLLVNSCKCKSLACITTEKLTLWEDEKNVSMSFGIVLKNNDTSEE